MQEFSLQASCTNIRKCADFGSYLLASRDIVPGIATYVMREKRRVTVSHPSTPTRVYSEGASSIHLPILTKAQYLLALITSPISLSLSRIDVGVDYGGGAKLKTD